jgi:hypothetical protein
MTNEITPPPALRQLWAQQAQRMNPRDPIAWQEHIANQAARWGANQELEACCDWLAFETPEPYINALRASRRPKPPSLKDQALQVLASAPGPDYPSVMTVLNADEHALIRQALEALPND